MSHVNIDHDHIDSTQKQTIPISCICVGGLVPVVVVVLNATLAYGDQVADRMTSRVDNVINPRYNSGSAF